LGQERTMQFTPRALKKRMFHTFRKLQGTTIPQNGEYPPQEPFISLFPKPQEIGKSFRIESIDYIIGYI